MISRFTDGAFAIMSEILTFVPLLSRIQDHKATEPWNEISTRNQLDTYDNLDQKQENIPPTGMAVVFHLYKQILTNQDDEYQEDSH